MIMTNWREVKPYTTYRIETKGRIITFVPDAKGPVQTLDIDLNCKPSHELEVLELAIKHFDSSAYLDFLKTDQTICSARKTLENLLIKQNEKRLTKTH